MQEEKTVVPEITTQNTAVLDPLGLVNAKVTTVGDDKVTVNPNATKATPDLMSADREVEEVEQAKNHYITRKDFTNLKRNNYDKAREKFKTSFVIENTKTKQIVELRAASSTHACNLIGWRPKNCKVIDVIEEKEEDKVDVNNTSTANENDTPKTEQITQEQQEANLPVDSGDGEQQATPGT